MAKLPANSAANKTHVVQKTLQCTDILTSLAEKANNNEQ